MKRRGSPNWLKWMKNSQKRKDRKKRRPARRIRKGELRRLATVISAPLTLTPQGGRGKEEKLWASGINNTRGIPSVLTGSLEPGEITAVPE
jgi:hypothetical protein